MHAQTCAHGNTRPAGICILLHGVAILCGTVLSLAACAQAVGAVSRESDKGSLIKSQVHVNQRGTLIDQTGPNQAPTVRTAPLLCTVACANRQGLPCHCAPLVAGRSSCRVWSSCAARQPCSATRRYLQLYLGGCVRGCLPAGCRLAHTVYYACRQDVPAAQ